MATIFDNDTLDKEVTDFIDANINLCVPWYLMACYAYYEEDDPILTDSCFDRLTRRMINHWEGIEHQHKDKITLDMLNASTYIGEYPSRVKGGLDAVRDAFKIGKKYR